MSQYGLAYDLIIYNQIIIWSILIIYLTYLALTTELTHVKGFRSRFLTGLFILIGTIAYYLVTRFILGVFSIENIQGAYVLNVGFIGFIIFVIASYLKLFQYLEDLIEIHLTTPKKIITLGLSIALSLIVCISAIFRQTYSIATIPEFIVWGIVAPTAFFVFNFSYLTSFVFHNEAKKANITFLVYFGLGFLSMASIQLPYVFFNVLIDPFAALYINFAIIAMAIFYILGFQIFRRQLKKVSEQIKALKA